MNDAWKRKLLFASLYMSEGAPIGFIWSALPTRLRTFDVPIGDITWLTALLVIPWTFKFLWAPVIDWLRTPRWSYPHWIVSMQCVMGLTLTPLLWLDPIEDFYVMAWVLFAHAISAATQDVAIDAYCIASTNVGERGTYNGWMQTGMLLGRAMLGGGALVLSSYFGDTTVILLLIMVTTFSAAMVITIPARGRSRRMSDSAATDEELADAERLGIFQALRLVLLHRNTWFGMFFGAIGPAVFKSLEVFYGPYLIDRGISQEDVGWFSMLPMIGLMVIGSILGGKCSDRYGARPCVVVSLLWICVSVCGLGLGDRLGLESPGLMAFPMLSLAAFGIGLFTASMYGMFMDITHPRIGATQFSALMGSTNGCESWSSFASGLLIANFSYSTAMFSMAAVSVLAIPLLFGLVLKEPERMWTKPK